MAAAIDTLDGFLREMKARYPDAVARAKLPPEIKADPQSDRIVARNRRGRNRSTKPSGKSR